MTGATTTPEQVAAPTELTDRTLVKNASVLFAGQAVGLVVPLLTIPYLARVLGPAGWGPVLACQALGNWLILVLEFGFELSGTRAVARARVSQDTMSSVVNGIVSAKVILVGAVLPLGLLAVLGVPALGDNSALLLSTLAFVVFRGFSPIWFFQGIERLQGAAAVDAVTRALAALGVFVAVHGASDGWRVLALQAGFAAISVVILTAWMARRVPLRKPVLRDGFRAIREHWTLFAYRAASGVYMQGSALVLSALSSAVTVAFYGGAERIIRAAVNLLQPVTQAFLPRVSYLHALDPSAAHRMIKRSLVALGAVGVAMGLVAVVGAPTLVHVLLGAKYASAVPVLRVMALVPPLVALNTVLGIYWALPFGHERALLGAIVAAGVVDIALAALLVPHLGALGMAIATVAAEVVVLAVLVARYLRYAE